MNRKSLIVIAIASVAAASAFADDITVDSTPFQSTKTRAEVQAELSQYKQAGVNTWANNYNPLEQFRSQRSRAEVTAEYIANRDRVAAFTAQDSGSAWLSAQRGQRDAAQTIAGQPANAQ